MTYEDAIKAHDEACRKFAAVRQDYRVGKATDKEFLAARADYDTATEAYDSAYAIEAQSRYADDLEWAETQDIQAGDKQ